MASQTRNPSQVNHDGETSWQALHKQGNDCLKKKEFRSAAESYTEAITILDREIGLKDASEAHMVTDIESHELAELYGYRAQCWRMLNQDRECLEDAQKSVDYDAKWFGGHFQLGCAFYLQGKHQLALSSLVHACNNWTPADVSGNAVNVIASLLHVMSLEEETSVDLKRLNARFGSDIWASVAVKYLEKIDQSIRSVLGELALTETQSDKLISAELAYQQIQDPASTKLDVDLSEVWDVLCRCRLRWTPSLILFLVESGTNIRTFTQGTWPYLHSVIWMVLSSGCSPFVDGEDSDAIKLVKWVLQKEVQVNGDWDLSDCIDRTVLYFLALLESEGRYNEEMILHLTKLFLEGGTDPLLKDKQGRTAIECSAPNGKLYNILKRFSQQAQSDDCISSNLQILENTKGKDKMAAADIADHKQFQSNLLSHGAHCSKNPGHEGFIPVRAFELSHLPEKYRDKDVLEYLQILAELTVRIIVKILSEARPECFPGSQYRGHQCNLTGTGFCFRAEKYEITLEELKDTIFCQCHVCKLSGQPKHIWWEVYVQTAAHVVFDDIDGANTDVVFFYHGTDSQTITIRGSFVRCVEFKQDISTVVCAIHDGEMNEFMHKLNKLHENVKMISEKVDKKYTQIWEELCVLISHPHGATKQISIGKNTDLTFGREGITTFPIYKYDTSTCPGSSGAIVIKSWWRLLYTVNVHGRCGQDGLGTAP